MADITTQQLAQLLLGIARAQNAIIEALENSKAGFKATHFRPAVETASRIRANRPETLTDYPVATAAADARAHRRPTSTRVLRDLERLLAQPRAPRRRRGRSGGAAGTRARPTTRRLRSADDDCRVDMTARIGAGRVIRASLAAR